MPFTGSDAYVLTVTLDKWLTKNVLAAHGIDSPRGRLVTPADLPKIVEQGAGLPFPVIVKPNYEGSSKGITQDSVVETPGRLREVVVQQLAKYASGVLIEEYIVGKDVTVPFLEALSNGKDGVLAPVEYVIDPKIERKYEIYDYELKTKHSDAVNVRAPAELTPEVTRALLQSAATVFKVTGCRDLGRIDLTTK